MSPFQMETGHLHLLELSQSGAWAADGTFTQEKCVQMGETGPLPYSVLTQASIQTTSYS